MGRRATISALIFAGLAALALLVSLRQWRARGEPPAIPTAPPFTPWPTPPAATAFDFPLLPAHAYGPYIPGTSGPLAVDTRYGAQNPALGDRDNCFRDAAGHPVPFSQLYHAGLDLFALDAGGQVVWGWAAHQPVHAVADGVVVFTLETAADGVIIVEHFLPDGPPVYSVYWHVEDMQVQPGQPVARGQVLAVVLDQGANSHLHWEMRTFRDGSNLFPPDSAGAACNGHTAGVAYTWDDDPARAHPDFYGYLDPAAFVESRPGESPQSVE